MSNRELNQVGNKTALRELREAANLTQEQMAFHMSKSSSTIRRWEKGEEPALTKRQWLKLCELLKTNFYDLPEFLSPPMPLTSEHPQETE